MSSHVAATFVVGILALATAWLPVVLRRIPITLPIVAVAFGAGLYLAAGRPDLEPYRSGWETLTEYVLVIAVMGAGLKIDRAFRWWAWKSTWILLAFAMPLSIALTTLSAWSVLGLTLPLSLLVGAILSPTDPVLASDVQVGPPGEGETGEVRFALTSEAGLNDGVAMPFVLLGIALIASQDGLTATLVHWVGVELVYHVAAGAALGALCGWALVAGDRAIPERFQLRASGDGLAVLGVSFLVYAIAELLHLNGFVAVFAAAVASRNSASDGTEFARTLHGFADQVERLAMVLLMTLFGALLASGLLNRLEWRDAIFVFLVLFVARPVAVLVSCLGSKLPGTTRGALGYFGIRGLGSLFYLFFALDRVDVDDPDRLRAIVALTVLASIAIYGLTSSPIMKIIDSRRHRAGAIYQGPVLVDPEPEDEGSEVSGEKPRQRPA